MWRTLKELLPLVVKGWWIWAIGGLAGVMGLMLDIFTSLGFSLWFWALLAVVALLAALIRAFHIIRIERDAYRPDPQSVGDWHIREVAQYVMNDSQWGVRQTDESIAFDKVLPQIREAALNKFIVVWGRRLRSIYLDGEPLTAIEKEYWADFTFEELRCLPADYGDEKVATKTRRDHGQDQSDDRIFEDLFLVRAQVKSYWPKAQIWQKYKLNWDGLLKPRRPV